MYIKNSLSGLKSSYKKYSKVVKNSVSDQTNFGMNPDLALSCYGEILGRFLNYVKTPFLPIAYLT